MVSKVIVKYIQNNLKKGLSSQEIRKILMNHGLSAKDVSEAFSLGKANSFIGKSKKPNKKKKPFFSYGAKLFLGFAFIVIFVVALFFILSNLPNSNKSEIFISKSSFEQGVQLNLSKNFAVNFFIDDQEYSFVLNEIIGKKICFSGALENVCLTENSKRSFDLNNDSQYDIMLQLLDVGDDFGFFYTQKYDNIVCVENWKCTDWGVCLNGLQKRLCADFNSCGTSLNVPLLQEECYTSSIQNYSYEPTGNILDCGNSSEIFVNDCFLNASKGCALAKTTGIVNNELDPFALAAGENISTNFSSYMEIGGSEEVGLCLFYEEVLSYSQAYTQDYVQFLLNNGKSLEEISQLELTINSSAQNLVGFWNLCEYNSLGFVAMLEDYNKNPFGGENCELEIVEENLDYTLYYVECVYGNISLTGECASGKV